MLIKSHEQLNQAVCETFFSSQLSKMGNEHKKIEGKVKKGRLLCHSIVRLPY